MARILITGASGLLGANLVLDYATEHEVLAVCHRHPVHLDGVEVILADLSQPGRAQEVIERGRPEWVIHCAAATDVDACEADPQMAFRLNRDMAGLVAEGARSAGARLAHISTDAVFDGEKGGYTEEDPPRPINVYGASKHAGEGVVTAAHPEALVVRTNIFGWNAQPKQCLAEWFLDHLEAGRPCPGFTDVWVTPILVNNLGEMLLRMLGVGLQGVYHVPGGECVTKHDFGVCLARVFGLDDSLIKPSKVQQAGLLAPRPRRLCLDGTKVETELRTRLPTIAAGLSGFKRLQEVGHIRSLESLLAGG